jgi:hypothetical protein
VFVIWSRACWLRDREVLKAQEVRGVRRGREVRWVRQVQLDLGHQCRPSGQAGPLFLRSSRQVLDRPEAQLPSLYACKSSLTFEFHVGPNRPTVNVKRK